MSVDRKKAIVHTWPSLPFGFEENWVLNVGRKRLEGFLPEFTSILISLLVIILSAIIVEQRVSERTAIATRIIVP